MYALKDHLVQKFKPTFFGLFETQKDYALNTLYHFMYDKSIWHSAAIHAHGVSSGYYKKVTLHDVQSSFDNCFQPGGKAFLLDKVNEYIKDLQSSRLFKPEPIVLERLDNVRDYFVSHMNSQDANVRAHT